MPVPSWRTRGRKGVPKCPFPIPLLHQSTLESSPFSRQVRAPHSHWVYPILPPPNPGESARDRWGQWVHLKKLLPFLRFLLKTQGLCACSPKFDFSGFIRHLKIVPQNSLVVILVLFVPIQASPREAQSSSARRTQSRVPVLLTAPALIPHRRLRCERDGGRTAQPAQRLSLWKTAGIRYDTCALWFYSEALIVWAVIRILIAGTFLRNAKVCKGGTFTPSNSSVSWYGFALRVL